MRNPMHETRNQGVDILKSEQSVPLCERVLEGKCLTRANTRADKQTHTHTRMFPSVGSEIAGNEKVKTP